MKSSVEHYIAYTFVIVDKQENVIHSSSKVKTIKIVPSTALEDLSIICPCSVLCVLFCLFLLLNSGALCSVLLASGRATVRATVPRPLLVSRILWIMTICTGLRL